jgi:hypothetical protein
MTNFEFCIPGRRPTYTPYFPLGCCFTSDLSRNMNMNSGEARLEEAMVSMELHRKTQTTVMIMLLGGQSLLCSSLRTKIDHLGPHLDIRPFVSFTCH